MKRKTVKLTENELNSAITEEIINYINEGAGWDVFKDSVKNGYNYKDKKNNPNKKSNATVKDAIKGKPNKLKSDYHKSMAGSTKDKDEKLKHSYKAVASEPGIKGKAKRTASLAGAVGGAVARDVVDGAKKVAKKVTDKTKKKSKKV